MADTTVPRARLATRQFIAALVAVILTYAATYAVVALIWALFA